MISHPHAHPGRSVWHRSALAAVLLAGTALGGFAVGNAGFAATEAAPSNGPVNPPGTVAAPQTLPDFTRLVVQVKPAVVSITTTLRVAADDVENPHRGAPELPFPFNQMIPNAPHQQKAMQARGSGFIISADGTIVTNNHVVKDARSVEVTLDDGSKVNAKVVGRDTRSDIAVLKITADKPLPYIQLGNSRDVRAGEWVIAMGNPFGLGGSVTAGIVSAVSRDIGAGPYDQFIQVDAPINQGNSGGPLFTQDGKVIGMNTAILSPSGGSIGIGFAIPSDMIRTVVAQLQQTGHVTRGYVGVEAQQITGATAKALRLPDNAGALLAGISADSPASRAGLEPGDVIQAVNGQKIGTPRELALNISSIKPGDEAHLKVLREGKAQDVTVKVGELPEERSASQTSPGRRQGDRQLGVALAPLSPDMRNQLDLPDGTRGAVVQRVQPGSPADQAGLQAGDVIVSVGGRKVSNPSEAVTAIRSALTGESHAVALRVIRDGEPLFVGVSVDQPSQDEG